MGHDTPKLSDEKVLTEARELLKEHLSLEADGYVCTTDDLFDVLLGIAVHRGTIQSVLHRLAGHCGPRDRAGLSQ